MLLSDLVVLDLSRALAGPHAGMMFGDLGARVIKVERPAGDDTRSWGPPFVGDDDISTYYLSCNRNKESITVDLKAETGREVLTRLIRRSDILIENFRPGVLTRLGFSYESLHRINPRLVICSISGFGYDGPEGARAGYDQIAQGEAGLMSVTGDLASPTKVGVPIADILAGLHATIGILAALHERAISGRGRVVHTSLLAGVVGAHAFQGTRWTVAGETPVRTGNHHPSIAPYGLFGAKDGQIQVAVGSTAQWHAFASTLGIDTDDPRFHTNADRVEHRDGLTTVINEKLITFTVAEISALLDEAGVPCGKVRTIPEVYDWDQTRSQGLVVAVDHPVLGSIELPGPPIRFDQHDYAGGREQHAPPPALGEHNDLINAWIALGSVDPLEQVNA
ncbi:MAG: CoA transferase [Mycobacterium sp.]